MCGSWPSDACDEQRWRRYVDAGKSECDNILNNILPWLHLGIKSRDGSLSFLETERKKRALPHNNHSGNNAHPVLGRAAGNHTGNKPSIMRHWQIYGGRQDTLGNMKVLKYEYANKYAINKQTNQPVYQHLLMTQHKWERVAWRVSGNKRKVGWG